MSLDALKASTPVGRGRGAKSNVGTSSVFEATGSTVEKMGRLINGKGTKAANVTVPTKVENAKKCYKLVKTIEAYYKKFPKLGSISDSDVSRLRKIQNPFELEDELERIQKSISAPFAEDMISELFYNILFAAEKTIAHRLQPAGVDINGLAGYIRSRPEEIETEITELSILYEDFFSQGPIARLAMKVVKMGYVVNTINKAHGNIDAQVTKAKINKYRDL